MNLRDLQYLVAVADHKHFGRAAEASFVSQPTLSAQLKKLEEYLGVQLVERSQRQVVITPIGSEIVNRARIILRDAEQIQEIGKNARDPFAGSVKIGIIPTLAPYLLPHIIPVLKSTFPKLEMFLFEDQTTRIHQQLKQAQLDVIILALPIEDESLVAMELFDEPFYAALPCQHKLNKKKNIHINDLQDETILLLTEGHCLRDQALDICSNVNIKHKRNFSATSLETLRQMVAADAGITLLPELAINSDVPNNNQITYKRFCKPEPSRKIGMLWRKSSAQKQLLEKMGDVIKQQIENR